ncbi:MAG: hypothetical protein HQL90_06060 [Magnetococcales bacterium]|nr:hypothetical protein [Magnetococcales bacterium]
MGQNFGKHKSLDKSARTAAKNLLRLPFVYKVVLGPSIHCRHHYPPGAVKFQRVENAGVRINLFSGRGVTVAYLYSKNREILIDYLMKEQAALEDEQVFE